MISQGANLLDPTNVFAGTTLTLQGQSVSFKVNYDGTHRNNVYTDSSGRLVIDQLDFSDFRIKFQGADVFTVQNNLVNYIQNSGAFATGNITHAANRARYCTYSQPGLGAEGIGGPASGTVSVVINDLDTVLFTTALVTFPAGIKAPALPTSDPHVAGVFWSNLGIVTVSAG